MSLPTTGANVGRVPSTDTSTAPLLTPLSSGVQAQGKSYLQLTLVFGGTPPYTFAIVNGAPPAGTHLDPQVGLVIGLPTATGTYHYTVQATDSLGQSVTTDVSGFVGPVVPGTETITGGSDNFIVPPYNILKVEMFGSATEPTTMFTEFGVEMEAASGSSFTQTFGLAAVGSPSVSSPMPYSIGEGSPNGEIILTWS